MSELTNIEYSEFDYQTLIYQLRDLKYPRDKISDLIRNKDIIRVKKGLYINPRLHYSKQVLANLIYGPSYISMHYALMKYRLIPEQVVMISSVTTQKNKTILTPVGDFMYLHQHIKAYFGGQTIITENEKNILMALPEKALADILYFEKTEFSSYQELAMFLFENLRIEENEFRSLDKIRFELIFSNYPSPKMHKLYKLISKLLSNGSGNY